MVLPRQDIWSARVPACLQVASDALFAQPGWRIAEAIFRLVASRGVAIDHRMLAVIDPAGKVSAQINGLASVWDGAAGQWQPIPIGYERDHRLRVYLTGDWSWEGGQVQFIPDAPRDTFWLSVLGTDGTRKADIAGAISQGLVDVAAGADGALKGADMARLLAKAHVAARALGSGDRADKSASGQPYPRFGLGPNSNSVAATLRAAMGLPPAAKGFGGWAPWYGKALLSLARLAAIAEDRFV